MRKFSFSACALALSSGAIGASLIYKAVDVFQQQEPLFGSSDALSNDASMPSTQFPSTPIVRGSRPMVPNGTQWAMTYVPYTAGGLCKTGTEIASDIGRIAGAGFTTVRLYSTDCNILKSAEKPLRKHNLGLVIGLHISTHDQSTVADQLADITAYSAWDTVELIALGNEAAWAGHIEPEDLGEFLGQTKGNLRKLGYTGPITTIEPALVWHQWAHVLCPHVDVVSANIQPFFDGSVTAAHAGPFVSERLSELEKICPGDKPAINTEVGWPQDGSANGDAVPGAHEQKIAIGSIRSHAGSVSAFHGFEDDAWKVDESPLGVEQHFGCLHVFNNS